MAYANSGSSPNSSAQLNMVVYGAWLARTSFLTGVACLHGSGPAQPAQPALYPLELFSQWTTRATTPAERQQILSARRQTAQDALEADELTLVGWSNRPTTPAGHSAPRPRP